MTTLPRAQVLAPIYEQMPTGVSVTPDGRIFLCFPRWFDDVAFTVGELRDGKVHAYPDMETNSIDYSEAWRHFLSVQSIVATGSTTLWVLDTGRPWFLPARPGAMKLVEVDLQQNAPRRTFEIPYGIARLGTYLNDVRFDFTSGDEGTAFITDSATLTPSAIIVIDLHTGKKLRRLEKSCSVQPSLPAPVIEGKPMRIRLRFGINFPYKAGVDGIAISPDGKTLYYCPLLSDRLYSVDTALLADASASDDDVAKSITDLGVKGFSDGLECDEFGRVYATDLERNRVRRRDRDGTWSTIAEDERMIWTDTLSIGADRNIYFTANQLNRMAIFNSGRDLRRPPYFLFHAPIDK